MEFPSFWLGIGLFAVFTILSGALSYQATLKDPLLGQQRYLGGDVSSLLGYIFTTAWFWALTGSFPITFALGGAGLYLLTGVALWFAFRAAGLPSERRLIQTSCLATVFMKPAQAYAGCLVFLVFIVASIAFAYVAYRTAEGADLSTSDGLFDVAMWVFTIPGVVFFLALNFSRFLTLYSEETPQQNRVTNFAQALRHFVLTGWSVSYPYLAFHRDLIEENPRWVTLAVIAFIVLYALLVVLPYVVGRTRFMDRSKALLEKLNDAASRIIVATDAEVSATYRDHMLRRVLADLQTLIRSVVAERPFFTYYLNKVSGPTAALADGRTDPNHILALPGPEAPDTSAAPAVTVGNWDKMMERYGAEMPRWDHRIYVIEQIQEMLVHPGDRGWLRGAALGARIEIARWLSRHYTRSVVVGSLGVVASAAFALALQAYMPELRALAEGVADSVASNLGLQR